MPENMTDITKPSKAILAAVAELADDTGYANHTALIEHLLPQLEVWAAPMGLEPSRFFWDTCQALIRAGLLRNARLSGYMLPPPPQTPEERSAERLERIVRYKGETGSPFVPSSRADSLAQALASRVCQCDRGAGKACSAETDGKHRKCWPCWAAGRDGRPCQH